MDRGAWRATVSMQACHTATKVLAEQIKCLVNFLLLPKPPLNSYQFLPLLQKWYYQLNTPSLNYIFFHSILFLNRKWQEYFIYHQKVPFSFQVLFPVKVWLKKESTSQLERQNTGEGQLLVSLTNVNPRVRPESRDQSGK